MKRIARFVCLFFYPLGVWVYGLQVRGFMGVGSGDVGFGILKPKT